MTKCDRYCRCKIQLRDYDGCHSLDKNGQITNDFEIVNCYGNLENCPKFYKPEERNKMTEYETKNYSDSEKTYADRFKAEYEYVKRKYNNLHKMIVQYEAGTLDFTPKCSLELFKRQAKTMGEYLYVLELRAEIEGIELE